MLEDLKYLAYIDVFEVHLMNPLLLCGMFIGGMMAFVFCAMTMKAVGRAAGAMVDEVRRQFKEIPGIMEGTGKPDYARCVDISTAGAQREMISSFTARHHSSGYHRLYSRCRRCYRTARGRAGLRFPPRYYA